MKKSIVKNVFLGLLFVAVVLIASYYDYKYQQEERQANEEMREANADQSLYEYHLQK